jgi:hypothetical protein
VGKSIARSAGQRIGRIRLPYPVITTARAPIQALMAGAPNLKLRSLSLEYRSLDDIFSTVASSGRFSVPSVRNNEFNRWFNSLSPEQLDDIWKVKVYREAIESRLRHPGGLHEWHLVSRTPTFKRWGISAESIKDMRTLIKDVNFVNPAGRHGGRGSTAAHNEILQIIDTSLDYNTFLRRLQNWASYRLKGGVNSLPEGLRP